MESLNIQILNPKAKKLLKDLADLKLISIDKNPISEFKSLLSSLRTTNTFSTEEIQKEVLSVRSNRNA